MKKIFSFVLHTALILALLAVAGLSLVSILPIPGQVEIKIVQSGSMEPAIHTGGIVVIQPADSYTVGDVITFGEDTRTQVPTTHRIISSREEGGVTYFTTKGDANEDPDGKETPRSEVIGRMLFTVPYVGYLIDFSKKPVGFISMIVIPAGLIILYELIGVFEEVRKLLRKKKEERERTAQSAPPSGAPQPRVKNVPRVLPALLISFALPGALLLTHAGFTALTLSDLEQTTGNTFAAGLLDLSLTTASETSAQLQPGEENGHTVIPVLTSSDDNLLFSYGVHAATEGDATFCSVLSVRAVSGPVAYLGPAAALSTGTTTDMTPLELLFFIPANMAVPPSVSCTITLTYTATQEGAAPGTEYHDDEHLVLTFTTPSPVPLLLAAPLETDATATGTPSSEPEPNLEEPAPEEAAPAPPEPPTVTAPEDVPEPAEPELTPAPETAADPEA